MENMEEQNIDSSLEYLSEEAYQKLEEELRDLIKNKRMEISERLGESSSLGDLSENAEYQEAKDAQLMNENRIAELEDLLGRTVILSSEKRNRDKIELGCLVILRKDESGVERKYQIVGSEEADPVENKISNESPLGLCLLGKKKGDVVRVVTPAGEVRYNIMKIQ
ncbi:transcription elongation factor GreA [Patescibacteria group bacterium]|nr:transcription elongation factor GreA [Patescibacteria group bacterium]